MSPSHSDPTKKVAPSPTAMPSGAKSSGKGMDVAPGAAAATLRRAAIRSGRRRCLDMGDLLVVAASMTPPYRLLPRGATPKWRKQLCRHPRSVWGDDDLAERAAFTDVRERFGYLIE